MNEDIRWLIETGSPAKWWQSGGRAMFGGEYIETWVDDASHAHDFRKKEWAEAEIKRLESFGVTTPMTATEHMFGCWTGDA